MIRRLLRLTFRLGLLTGIGLALFKVLKGRRSASEFGSPSADWAPPPVPNPNLPTTPPEPALIEPVMFEEIKERKAAVRAVPDPAPDPAPMAAPEAQPAAPRKAAPAKKAPPKKAAPPAAAGPVKKVVPKKAPAKKVASAPAADAPVAKKATPAKKAAKKQP